MLIPVEHLKGWLIIMASKSKTAAEAAPFFQREILIPFWSRNAVVTGNGPAFSRSDWKHVLPDVGVNAKSCPSIQHIGQWEGI